MQPTGTLKLIKTCEMGTYYQLDSGKVIFLSHQDLELDFQMKASRTKFEEETWPFLWMLIKIFIPVGPIGFRNSPRTREGALMEDYADLYFLTKADLLRCGNIQETLADKLLISIKNSKTRPLGKIIFALGILNVGREWADKLAKRFQSIDKLGRATWSELISIPGLGSSIALSILEFFHTEGNWKIIEKMRIAGVQLEIPSAKEVPVSASPISGKTFMFTGRLESMTRHTAQSKIEELGGIAGSSVTKTTDYLVVGESPGSKLMLAHHLEVPTLTEEDFLNLLKEAPNVRPT